MFNLIGLLPSIYRYKKTPPQERLKIEMVLEYLEVKINETDSKLLKRRYCLLLSSWAQEMNLITLMDYLAKSCSLLFSGGTSDIVIKFEAMNSFRDILRVIEDVRSAHKNKAIIEEESAKIIESINERLNYHELFETISPICINTLNEFESPTQIWRCVNLISLLIEGCKENSDENTLIHFKNINFMKMIQLDSLLLKEALYDMCKNLISIFRSSHSILEINFTLIEHNLKIKPDYELFDLWLYILRIFELNENPDAQKMCYTFLQTYYEALFQCGKNGKFTVQICQIIFEYILANLIGTEGVTIPGILQYCVDLWKNLNQIKLSEIDVSTTNLMERKEYVIKVSKSFNLLQICRGYKFYKCTYRF